MQKMESNICLQEKQVCIDRAKGFCTQLKLKLPSTSLRRINRSCMPRFLLGAGSHQEALHIDQVQARLGGQYIGVCHFLKQKRKKI